MLVSFSGLSLVIGGKTFFRNILELWFSMSSSMAEQVMTIIVLFLLSFLADNQVLSKWRSLGVINMEMGS